MPFVKIDCSILYSSVWCESLEVRVLWIAMLAASDPEGIVRASAPGLAKLAGLPLNATLTALEVLESPDPFSKSPEHEGRRVERCDGGFFILNYGKYRSHDYSMNREAVRKREYREKTKHYVGDIKRDIVPPCPGHSASASSSISASSLKKKIAEKEEKRTSSADAETLTRLFLSTLSDEMQTKIDKRTRTTWDASFDRLLKEFDIDRLKVMILFYRRDDFWAKNFLSPLKLARRNKDNIRYVDYFFERMKAQPQQRPDGRTVSADFSADEELARKQREKWGLEKEADNVQT